jgi:tetratricopeptide (TPR) repeat protein
MASNQGGKIFVVGLMSLVIVGLLIALLVLQAGHETSLQMARTDADREVRSEYSGQIEDLEQQVDVLKARIAELESRSSIQDSSEASDPEGSSGLPGTVPPTAAELSEQAHQEQLDQQLDNDLVRLEALIKDDPTNKLLGEEYVQLALAAGQIDRAIEFLKSLAEETNDKWAHLRYSHALAMKLEAGEGELDPMTMGALYFKSIESLDTALGIDETFVDARFYRAMMNYYAPSFMKKNKATVTDLRYLKDQLKDDPNHEYVSQVFSFLAQALVRDGNFDEAGEVLDEGTALLPADQALLEQLQELQEIQTRPYLGVITYSSYSDEEGLKLIINEVIDGTTAAVGGLKNKDQIVSIGGQVTNTPDELVAALKNFPLGQTVDAVIIRGGTEMTLPLVLQGRAAD